MDSYLIGLGNNDTKTRVDASLDYVKFWESQAKKLHWFEPWNSALEWKAPFAKWFVGGKINASYNALDIQNPDKIAILWEGENEDRKSVTYGELLDSVQRLANGLKSLGVKKGDRITIYLPMVPELIVSILACARIGAIHTVIFSGFSSQSIRDRLVDSQSKIIITADGGFRRGNVVKLKEVVDLAIQDLDFIQNVIVLTRTKNPINMT
ncbi:MAG TPA: AMP-binding protein, partial [Candidatus Nitrosotenuis sp.]|nr:AMP-binding protein [Candidatus Nitrosotenuis sp.]HII03697.1 AMP-binding protein [Candidatus Nitrosotenuis sp.]